MPQIAPLPDDTQRLVIIGRTGSGKTQIGVHHLSMRSYDKMPWIIFDFKGDKLIGSIREAKEISITSDPPKKPGLYVVRPFPDQKEEVESFLWKIWAQEHVGIYIDEGYMVAKSSAFRALLTQGRSKHVPIIVLSQRPVWMDRFVWSEADYFQVLQLNSDTDVKAVQDFIPVKVRRKMPQYHSQYYSVSEDILNIWSPVPHADQITETFTRRLGGRRKIM